jgi:molybdopterin-guanine dinucleotide biosynthesis protein
VKAIGFIGYSNSGKTTLIEKLIPRRRGTAGTDRNRVTVGPAH